MRPAPVGVTKRAITFQPATQTLCSCGCFLVGSGRRVERAGTHASRLDGCRDGEALPGTPRNATASKGSTKICASLVALSVMSRTMPTSSVPPSRNTNAPSGNTRMPVVLGHGVNAPGAWSGHGSVLWSSAQIGLMFRMRTKR